MLSPGLRHSFEVEVTADRSPAHLAPTIVLSTPDMIGFMERAAKDAVQRALVDGETTVGTHVNVSHERAARGGEHVVFAAVLRSVDGRRLEFDVSATVGDTVIGRGTHQRTIVDRGRFSAPA